MNQRNQRRMEEETCCRREFLAWSGALAAALPAAVRGAETAATSTVEPRFSETMVTELYRSFTPDQKKILCFGFDDPLRKKVSANWDITKPAISELTKVQQDIVAKIFQGLTSEDGLGRFKQQMEDDAGGLNAYHIAVFGEPGGVTKEGKPTGFEFVLTGRHATMRADGNTVDGAAFGGPIVYGHDPGGFDETAEHPGNVFWYQAKRANEVFAALNPDQRKIALGEKAPPENKIQPMKGGYPGLAIGEMTGDQQKLVWEVMGDLLRPYRKDDVDEVLDIVKGNGGLEKVHLSYYRLDPKGQSADLGGDGVWDVWRLEGPGMVWHFRGAPHVHTWVNIVRA